MNRIETDLPGVCILEPRVFEDRRGFFFESYNERALAEVGITDRFVQDNHSRSSRGTLRGLHYQAQPGQVKLVRVVVGEVYDVALDIRRGSPTYGRHVSVVLSAENKVSGYYAPQDERGVLWNDPALGIAWPVGDPILSDKDLRLPLLRDIPRDYIWRG